MPGMKEKPQEKGNYKLCWVAWNPHLYWRQWEQLSTKEETPKHTVIIWKTSLHVWKAGSWSWGQPGHHSAAADGFYVPWTGRRKHQRWAAQTIWQYLHAACSSGSHHGGDLVQPCCKTPTAPHGSHQQIRAGSMGHQFPRVPRHHAPVQQPSTSPISSSRMRCESHCPSHSPYKTSSAWCSHRHSAKVPHRTINGQGMCPCSLEGQKPQCPPCRQTRLPASSKARALLQNPSHSGSEHCK